MNTKEKKFDPQNHNYSHQELVLHAVLLSRNYEHISKETLIKMYSNVPKEELEDYILHYFDEEDETIDGTEDICAKAEDLVLSELSAEKHYCPSCTCGDYSPSCPWNAPGMSIHDFI